MSLTKELVQLNILAKTKLSSLPGVISINEYGSIINGKADKYSDIDLEIVVEDILPIVENLKNTIESVSKVYTIMPISFNEHERIYTVVWRGFPLYYKMDLKLKSLKPRAVTDADSLGYDENMRLYDDFLIGVIRYAKYRNRKMHWAAFKFYKSSIEMWIKQNFNNSTLDDFIRLDQKKDTRRRWLYNRNSKDLDKTMMNMTKEFISNMPNHGHDFGLSVVEFLRDELRVK